MTERELAKSLRKMLKHFNIHLDNCLIKILTKIEPLLKDIEIRNQERKQNYSKLEQS